MELHPHFGQRLSPPHFKTHMKIHALFPAHATTTSFSLPESGHVFVLRAEVREFLFSCPLPFGAFARISYEGCRVLELWENGSRRQDRCVICHLFFSSLPCSFLFVIHWGDVLIFGDLWTRCRIVSFRMIDALNISFVCVSGEWVGGARSICCKWWYCFWCEDLLFYMMGYGTFVFKWCKVLMLCV